MRFTSTHLGVFRLFLGQLLIWILVSGAHIAWSQSTATGTVSGQVTDEQGAAVPATEVKLSDVATSAIQSTLSNETGRYSFLNVPPGKYNITLSKEGFSVYRVSAQKVDVGQVQTINATLEVGTRSTTIEVTAAPGAELQVTSATVGTTITGQPLIFLPNFGRDASTLAIFQPGVSPEGSVAGAAWDQNTFQLDGGNNSSDMDGSMNIYTPTYANNTGCISTTGGACMGTPTGVMPTPVESIEEFKVATANQTADFNGSSGSQVQMVTRRGTDQIHGAAYEYYFANDVGAANSWDNNHTPSAGHTYTPLPISHNNRFGASLAGTMLPNLAGGKTYFFFNYEGFRFPGSAVFERPTPTALMRAGVIQIRESGGETAYNLNTTPVTVNGVTYQPAVCPTESCDPRGLGLNSIVSQLWSKYMPLPNDPLGGDHFNTQGFRSTLALPQNSNIYVVRIDHAFGSKWRFMTSYRHYRFVQLSSAQVDIGGALPGDSFGQSTSQAARPQAPSYWVSGLTTNITPAVTNDFRFSYLRNFWQWASAGAPPQLPGLGGALEIGGESGNSLIPYNVNTQNARQRFWDGQDKMLRDDVSWLKSNHLIGFGGTYQRNFDYHLRNDNGGGILNSPVYQIGGSLAGVVFPSQYIPTGVPTNQLPTWRQLYTEVLGLVTQPQDLYTRSGAQLQLQPPGAYMYDRSIIDFFNLYAGDTWHIRPTFTLSYGFGYQVEMPPYELNGKQIALTDASGNAINLTGYLAARRAAALQGQVYNPTLGFSAVRNVPQLGKYPYEPFYGGLSPRVAAAWNPNPDGGILGKVFGHGRTVLRGGYGRIFGRLNGADLVLWPLLGTGLGQAVSCIGASMAGQCLGNGGVDPTTAFRIGADGLAAPLPTVSQTLIQPYLPGIGGNAAAGSGSVLDPKFRPSRTDNFTLSIQREISRNVILEAGYIGRIIRNEWQPVDADAVPYMTTLNGQSFAQAFAKTYFAVAAHGTPAPQPFLEAALGGGSSGFCKGFASCTAAVAANSTMNPLIFNVQVYDLWATLEKNASWTLSRTMPSSPISGGSGQLSAIYMQSSIGYGNYNAAYTSLRLRDWHGLTTIANFTWGRALGTGNQPQAASAYSVLDPWNLQSMYGPQFYDYKFNFNLAMMWQPSFYRAQKGLVGHLLGGWTIAPLFTARSGAALSVSNLNGGCQSFGEMNCATGSTLDYAVLAAPYTGSASARYNQTVSETASANPNGAGVNTNYDNGGVGVNMFKDPAAIFAEFRPCILGYDTNCGANGQIRGMSFWNLDATVSKDIGVWKEGRVGATLLFQFTNVLNHVQLCDPGAIGGCPALDISAPQDWGVLPVQVNTSRQIEFGLRIHF
jgi:hypothetical protein